MHRARRSSALPPGARASATICVLGCTSVIGAACGLETPESTWEGCELGSCDSIDDESTASACNENEQFLLGVGHGWFFDVSTYNVESTLGFCEHQGIGTRHIRYAVQIGWVERPVLTDDGELRCDVIETTRITEHPGFGDVVNNWYNHGRTVSYQPSAVSPSGNCYRTLGSDFFEPELKISISPGENPINGDLDQMALDIDRCLSRIPDGACEAFCGSCRYCLPMPVPGYPVCYDSELRFVDEDLGGHNSNNDAEMERFLWEHCVSMAGVFPDRDSPDWVGTCTDVCGGPDQPNRATCSGVDMVTADPDYTSTDECSFDGVYGPADPEAPCPTETLQPVCIHNDNWVCGLG